MPTIGTNSRKSSASSSPRRRSRTARCSRLVAVDPIARMMRTRIAAAARAIAAATGAPPAARPSGIPASSGSESSTHGSPRPAAVWAA